MPFFAGVEPGDDDAIAGRGDRTETVELGAAEHHGRAGGAVAAHPQTDVSGQVAEGLEGLLDPRPVDLAGGGELRSSSNMGGGQMVAADFIMTPSVVFSEGNAGGVGGAAVGRLFGGVAGAVAGGLKFKEAQTSMLVADARSTVQVAAAEGSTKKADMRLGGALFGGGGGAATASVTPNTCVKASPTEPHCRSQSVLSLATIRA